MALHAHDVYGRNLFQACHDSPVLLTLYLTNYRPLHGVLWTGNPGIFCDWDNDFRTWLLGHMNNAPFWLIFEFIYPDVESRACRHPFCGWIEADGLKQAPPRRETFTSAASRANFWARWPSCPPITGVTRALSRDLMRS